jgi:hypothetical protein
MAKRKTRRRTNKSKMNGGAVPANADKLLEYMVCRDLLKEGIDSVPDVVPQLKNIGVGSGKSKPYYSNQARRLDRVEVDVENLTAQVNLRELLWPQYVQYIKKRLDKIREDIHGKTIYPEYIAGDFIILF